MTQKRGKRSRVPAGRVERLFRFGLMAGELAAGGLYEGARRVVGVGAEAAGEMSALLAPAQARRLARRLSQMRGAAMKLGQLLSLESEDILPPEFAEALAGLRAQADRMPDSQVRRVLGREYGKGWETRFERFDIEPVAAASIGQVHRARTVDGRDLALKIQYPGVARSIDSDVDNVAALLRLARVLPVEIDASGIITEAKRQLRQEADYLQEAEHLRRYRKLVADEPRLWVPGVHDDLTTRRILAMDFARGVPIETLRERGTPQADRDAVGTILQRLVFRELFEFRFVQTDPNFANYLIEAAPGDGADADLQPVPDGRILLLDFGASRTYSHEFTGRYAALCRAVIAGDRVGVQQAATHIGYLHEEDPPQHVRPVVDLMFLVCEPFRRSGVYRFERSTLASRTRDAGLDLAFRKGFLRAPPPETVFLHRKLVGTFLLCGRIRAHVDVRACLEPFLGAAASAAHTR
jgi:predicted unusual protein kinase regulating ubiquinone biosynthesis (AarF/ABC1/UbiB family)